MLMTCTRTACATPGACTGTLAVAPNFSRPPSAYRVRNGSMYVDVADHRPETRGACVRAVGKRALSPLFLLFSRECTGTKIIFLARAFFSPSTHSIVPRTRILFGRGFLFVAHSPVFGLALPGRGLRVQTHVITEPSRTQARPAMALPPSRRARRRHHGAERLKGRASPARPRLNLTESVFQPGHPAGGGVARGQRAKTLNLNLFSI